MLRIIIPVFNEAKNIEGCVLAINSYTKAIPHMFYIVNDGSYDETAKVLRKLSRKFPISLIAHKENKGVAEALKSGLSKVLQEGRKGDVIIVTEGDGTSDPALIGPMLAKIKTGCDIVIASRYVKGGGYKDFPLKRHVLSLIANRVLKIAFPYSHVSDYTIFYRAYKFEIIKRGVEEWGKHIIETKYFTANTELLVKMMAYIKKVGEVPFFYDYGKKVGRSGLAVKTNLIQYFKFIVKNVWLG